MLALGQRGPKNWWDMSRATRTHFPYFRTVAVNALVTTYVVLGRAAHVDRLRGDLRQEGLVCVGDKFSGDNSRVSCKDVMVNSIHSGGLLMAGPVQVMPDRAAALKDRAAESSRGVGLPMAGGAARGCGRRELRTPPRSYEARRPARLWWVCATLCLQCCL